MTPRERRYTNAVRRQAQAVTAYDRATPYQRTYMAVPAPVSEVLRRGDTADRHTAREDVTR